MTEIREFRYGHAVLTLNIWDLTRATISDLYSSDRKKGHATMVMKQTIEFADNHGMLLVLVAESYDEEDGLTTAQLIKFYQKFGFVSDSQQDLMERQPKMVV